jgi:hypothetical protein
MSDSSNPQPRSGKDLINAAAPPVPLERFDPIALSSLTDPCSYCGHRVTEHDGAAICRAMIYLGGTGDNETWKQCSCHPGLR